MAEVLPVALSPSRKRPLEDQSVNPGTPSRPLPSSLHASEPQSSPLTVLSTQPSPQSLVNPAARQPSPAPSSTNSISDDAPGAIQNGTSAAGTQAAKRRKLTVKEKEEKRLEKEAKEKAKAELKAQKEEEKRMKDEEKRKKNEEKEGKKRAKELELQQKEEEKRKKERSQMRLNAFFVKPQKGSGEGTCKPSSSSKPPSSAEDGERRKSVSLEPGGTLLDSTSRSPSPHKKAVIILSDYERYFLPFELPSHAVWASYNYFMADQGELEAARKRLEDIPQQDSTAMEISQPDIFKSRLDQYALRGERTIPVRDIIARLNGSPNNPIDLTDDTKAAQPLELLKKVSMKYLHFGEDIRPPYYGTFSKRQTRHEASRLARNPFCRYLPETDYDYDSEAEWEEPEEGEDLDSEGEDDDSVDGGDDLDGFLDDEDAAENKSRLITGDLEPVSTGLCWEDANGVSRRADGSGEICHDFREFKMEMLLEPQPRSIDPFSTTYWQPNPAAATTRAVPSKEAAGSASNGLMNPPRLPLTSRPNCMISGMINTLNSSGTDPKASKLISVIAASKPAKPPKRMVPPEQLQEFKDAIQGSDLTKLALVEALKKKFPKLPKDVINNTLSNVAARVGAKEVDKRWVILAP